MLGPDPCSARSRTTAAPTRTHALLAGSPAIDAGSNPLGLANDQRGAGFLRVVGGVADMGAYESGATLNLTNYAYLSQFGTAAPFGVAIDPTSHNIVVTDQNNARVQIYSSAGVPLSQFGTPGTGNGQFNSPLGVAIDPTSHNIVVVDSSNNRVQIFSSAGVYLSQFGALGTGDGQFSQPNYVAIDPTSHNIVVTEAGNSDSRVQIFSSAGVYLSQVGSVGFGNGQHIQTSGVAIDPTSHNILVVDPFNHRVQTFSSAGVYLSQFGSAGQGDGQFRTRAASRSTPPATTSS